VCGIEKSVHKYLRKPEVKRPMKRHRRGLNDNARLGLDGIGCKLYPSGSD
jgi:hypothetical protein